MKQRSSGNFDKFAKKKSNAAVKEQFKQEKRKLKKEKEAFFDKKKQETRQAASLRGTSKAGPGQQIDAAAVPQFPNAKITQTTVMPLNKFIAHCGVCARRDAAAMVKAGKVKVNGDVVSEPGFKVTQKDTIIINGKKIMLTKNLVYILLNKPKDYITTTDDPQNRKTVLDLLQKNITERLFPVGRLDRNTSGVLLVTNDGDLSQKLTHPSNEVKKIYAVTLNKPLEKKDFEKILQGVKLEDGLASVDVLAYADAQDKTQVGVEIHSGRNRIVRRIFEALGYDVKNLDRVMFAGLTKKNVDRGKWRFLTEKEVRDLKYFGKGNK
jgi:23S rRNA pseudouridine2605 synthase